MGVDDARAMVGDERTAALRNANACQQLAELCGEVLQVAPELTAREFLRTLGALVAGIDPGVHGFRQLARGGANGLIGAGFRAEYDDGTAGQARHFAGTAAGAALVGDRAAELLAHHVVDPAESIDGHLSTAALEFARLLMDGELALSDAGVWVSTHVCDPDFQTVAGYSPFDALVERSSDAEDLRARFSDAEWRALCELPERVAVAATLADASGGFEDARDLIAGMRRIEAGSESTSVLVRAMAAERYDEGFVWGGDGDVPEDRMNATLRATSEHVRLLRGKGVATEEIVAFANFLLEVAGNAVRGSKSGGLLGIGAHAVSKDELAFLERLEDALEAELPACDGCLG